MDEGPTARMPRFDPEGSAAGWSIPSAVFVVYALALALGLGLGSAYLATRGRYPLGGVQAGPWVAWPRIGSREADPYGKAVDARTGAIPLAIGEGLTITAETDDMGRPLRSNCVYRIGGDTPAARAWTLTVYDGAGRLAPTEAGRAGFTSTEILREANGTFAIVLAREARPGNWLSMPSSERVGLVLRLYDTPASSGSAALDPKFLPSISALECD